MKLYSSNEDYKLYQGNMLDMLEVIEPNSIDSIVTDPPYGLTSITKRFGKENSAECQYGKDGSFARLSRGFMGKEWDGSGIEYNIETWKKCYEVLKPGGYLLAFGGSRTFHRIACAIEDAGFEIRDTIMWLYGSGFPKSMDISKSLDKRNGRNLDIYKEIGKHIKQKREEKNITLKEMNDIFGYVAGCNWWESQNDNNVRLPNYQDWLKLKEIINVSSKYDEIILREEATGEKIGEKIRGNAGFSKEQVPRPWKEKIGEVYDITAPSTDLAKQWQGWGTCLKPSFEPIIVARKPFKGSLVDNVIEYGVGGINIDECRVEYEKTTNPATNPLYRQQNADKYKQVQGGELSNGAVSWTSGKNGVSEMGRFPANTILTYDETDFDEVCGGFPDTKGGNRHNIAIRQSDKNSGYGFDVNTRNEFNDSGSASRYFYCAKASKKDRDEGLDTFNQEKVNDGRQTPIDNAFQRGETLRKNTHPTVKPTELMQYLVRLVSPDGATILDPFNGSGSTGKAVMYENKERNKNYKYIGIELTEEYLPITKARIEYVCNLTQEQLKEQQMTIFDYLESKGE